MHDTMPSSKEASRRSKPTLPIPREHGAYGILLQSLLIGLFVCPESGGASLPYGVAMAFAVLAGFLAEPGLEGLLASRGRDRAAVAWTLGFTGLGLALGLWLLAAGRWWLIAYGVVVLIAGAARWWLTRTGQSHSVTAELLGVVGLTAAGPAVVYAASGRLSSATFWFWIILVLYFAGPIFYVKMRVRQRARRQPVGSGTPRALAALGPWAVETLAYHWGAFILVAILAWRAVIPPAAPLAFLPFLAKATFTALRPTRPERFDVRRLGWTEAALGLIFAALVIVAYRLG
ncbi:MAG: YwiC-like family protein [Bacillota bacterium]